MKKDAAEPASSVVDKAFGAANRTRLLDEYFATAEAITPENAWKHIYRLLLWIDATTGLAHCYESDKSQPGKPWYPRSIAFHLWLSKQFGVASGDLGSALDWLFRRASADLRQAVKHRSQGRARVAERQRSRFANEEIPVPGIDPQLESAIRSVLGDRLQSDVDPEEWQALCTQIREYVTAENKRKNLVGEGFEDILAAVLTRASNGIIRAQPRVRLQTVPGFSNIIYGQKPVKVDLVASAPRSDLSLVSAKWSIRADREKQFSTDFADYLAARSDNRKFSYVLVTNEFDPARLKRAVDQVDGAHALFARVVHINTEAVKAVYATAPTSSSETVLDMINAGQIVSFSKWVRELAGLA